MVDTIGPKTKSGQLRLEDVPCPACEADQAAPCLFCMGKRAVTLTRAIEFAKLRDTDPAPPPSSDQKLPK